MGPTFKVRRGWCGEPTPEAVVTLPPESAEDNPGDDGPAADELPTAVESPAAMRRIPTRVPTDVTTERGTWKPRATPWRPWALMAVATAVAVALALLR